MREQYESQIEELENELLGRCTPERVAEIETAIIELKKLIAALSN
jgi:hypothetical protein